VHEFGAATDDVDVAKAATARRRAVQPLWSALDRVVAPHLDAGLLLCVSGGPDSAALLEATARWQRRLEGAIEVASVDHGHREAARDEADAVAARARALGFDAHAVSLPPPTRADEATLRAARYDALEALASSRGLAGLVTAHHQADDAEGFVLDALGWGGGRGGAAAPEVGARGQLTLLRPFVGLSRGALRLALGVMDAPPALVDDADRRGVGRRARVRLRALPTLATLEPGASSRLATKGARRREDEAALFELAEPLLEVLDDAVLVDGQAPRAIVRRALELALTEVAPRADRRSATSTLDLVLEAMRAEPRSPPARFDLPGAVAFVEPPGARIRARSEQRAGASRAGEIDPAGGRPGLPEGHPRRMMGNTARREDES
jgi:tRNA(Ile)-lysidine synthase